MYCLGREKISTGKFHRKAVNEIDIRQFALAKSHVSDVHPRQARFDVSLT